MLRGATIVAVLLGVGFAVPAAQADDPGYDVVPLALTVQVGPDGDTPCTIVADLYRPHGATRSSPAPAILTTHGFGGSKADQVPIGRGFARQGYVVLAYSGLGFGGSGCKIYLDDPDWDGKAGSQLVDVLAGTRTATNTDTGEPVSVDFVQLDAPGDPRVGMVGGSYGGQIQYAVAAVSQKVDALVPIITWNDLAYSLAPNNTSLSGVSYTTPGVHKKQWTSFFFALGIADGAQYATVDPNRMVGCPNFNDPACPAKAELETLGYPGQDTVSLARHASVASYVDKIHAPTLLLQGQKDSLFNLQEAVATYRALKAQGTRVSMVWQSWGHSGGTPAPGELDLAADDIRDSYLGARIADWFDHWLREDDTAPVGPDFSYFRDWVYDETGSAAAAYATADAYPVGRAEPFYLSGTDQLTTSSPVAGRQSFVTAAGGAPTSYSETSALEGSVVNNPVFDAPGSFAAYTSAPLAHDLSVAGMPTVDVRLSAPTAEVSQTAGPGGMLVLFAKVYDIAPDGTRTLKNRLVSPIRIADVRKPLHVELPGVVQRFAAGHRVQLVFATGDAAYAGNALAHTVTVLTDGGNPGVLRLPVVGPPPVSGLAR